jgi:aspartate aminotransferase/aminotransferase
VGIPVDVEVFDFERFITPRTKVIIINNPNNPRGRVYTLAELAHLNQLARKHSLYVLSDEAYSDFLLDSGRFVSMANLDTRKSHTIVVNSISKNFGISGWRLGYIISNEALIAQMLKLNQHLVTCPATILEYYIAKHFDEIIEITKPQMRAVVEKRARIAASLPSYGLSALSGDSTFYLFVSIAGTKLGSERFCDELLERYRVCAVPGIGYGESCDRFIRVGIGTESDERIAQGLRSIAELIASTRDG